MSIKKIPITIITGFLGAGKTTFINKVLNENKDKKFGLLINEFGEIGIDGQLVETSDNEEIVEMSNGCICCVVRTDLVKAVQKLVDQGIDYILIETSGLAEPAPVIQTFEQETLGGKIYLDGVVCLIDAQNYDTLAEDYKTALEQIKFSDIIILNKVEDAKEKVVEDLELLVNKFSRNANVLKNNNLDTKLVIETGNWTFDRLAELEDSHAHSDESEHAECKKCCGHGDCDHKCDDDKCENHNHHKHHEHEEIDEFVYVKKQPFHVEKIDDFFSKKLPKNIIRGKGFMNIDLGEDDGQKLFLFQMVGASKIIHPLEKVKENLDPQTTKIVFIGKDIDKQFLASELDSCLS